MAKEKVIRRRKTIQWPQTKDKMTNNDQQNTK